MVLNGYCTFVEKPHIYVDKQIQLVWPSGAPLSPDISPGAWPELHRICLWEDKQSKRTSFYVTRNNTFNVHTSS